MKNPINLKDLPGYLSYLKRNNKTDETLVVDIGRIESPKNNNVLRNITMSLLFIFLFGASLVTYNIILPEKVIITLNKDDINSVSGIAEKMNGEVVSVKKTDDESYEVVLSVKRSLRSALDRVFKSKN